MGLSFFEILWTESNLQVFIKTNKPNKINFTKTDAFLK